MKSTLDELETPLDRFPAAQAWVAPPAAGTVDVPQIYIWGAQFDEKRQTAGRGKGGAKEVKYDLHIWIYASDAADSPDADSSLPLLIGAVMNKLRTMQMVQTLTDPDTGETSQMLEIGENIKTSYGAPRATADQRLQWLNALVTTRVVEYVVA